MKIYIPAWIIQTIQILATMLIVALAVIGAGFLVWVSKWR